MAEDFPSPIISPEQHQATVPIPEPGTTDALIEVVSQQIDLLTFDPTDVTLLQQLVESFGDLRDTTQLKLVGLFGEIGEDATPTLIAALKQHPSSRVRHACAQALAQLGDPDSIPALIQTLLTDSDPITRSSASGALARMGSEAVSALLEVIASPLYPNAQKGQASWALSCLGVDATDQLYEAFESTSVDVRCAVVRAIATVAQNTATNSKESSDLQFPTRQLLLRAIIDPEPIVRIEAIFGLSKLSDYDATPCIIPLLSDIHPEIRKAAALALGSLKDFSTLEHLHSLINDPSPVVRPVVEWAIQQLHAAKHADRLTQQSHEGA